MMGELSHQDLSLESDSEIDNSSLLNQAFSITKTPSPEKLKSKRLNILPGNGSSKRLKVYHSGSIPSSKMSSDQNKRKLDAPYVNGNRRYPSTDNNTLEEQQASVAGPSTSTASSRIAKSSGDRYQRKSRVRSQVDPTRSSVKLPTTSNTEQLVNLETANGLTNTNEERKTKNDCTNSKYKSKYQSEERKNSLRSSDNSVSSSSANTINDGNATSSQQLESNAHSHHHHRNERQSVVPNAFNFRRDDPGRRPFSRSQTSGTRNTHSHSSPQRSQNNTRENIRSPSAVATRSPVSNEELNEFLAVSSQSDSERRNYFFSPINLRSRNRTINQPVQPAIQPYLDLINSQEEEQSFSSFTNGSPRRLSRRLNLAQSDNRRRSRGHRRTMSVPERFSPDPIAQVQQLEDDEVFARVLQAQFDAELFENGMVNVEDYQVLDNIEDDSLSIDVVLDEDETRESPETTNSSSSSDVEIISPRTAPIRLRNTTRMGSGAVRSVAARAERFARNNTRPTNVPPIDLWHHHGHQNHNFGIRSRRGRPRVNSDPVHPLTYHFNRLIQWTIGIDVSSRNEDEPNRGDDYDMLWNIAESIGEVVPRGLNKHEINRLPTRKFSVTSNSVAPGTSSSSSSSERNRSHSNNNGGSGASSSSAEGLRGNKECQVCLSEFSTGEQLRILPCFHDFHSACIDRWLKNNNTCPICRAEVKFE